LKSKSNRNQIKNRKLQKIEIKTEIEKNKTK